MLSLGLSSGVDMNKKKIRHFKIPLTKSKLDY